MKILSLFLGLILVSSVLITNQSFAESPNSIQQKISNTLAGSDFILEDKRSFIVEELLKTSYKIRGSAYDRSLNGSVIIWSDIDGKYVNEIEISTSHYNDAVSQFAATVLLVLVKTGFMTSEELDDRVLVGMIQEAVKGKEPTIVTTSGYKVKVNEIIVLEGTPGLGMFFLTVNYNPETFVSTPSDAPQTEPEPVTEERRGGCLIATATYGSELAPQVQQLRELRDNTLLQTNSGSAFMSSFNQFYYSFSPIIADWERQNPVFKDAIKLTITPLITTLSILEYVDIDSEEEMLGYGIGVILLNVGMYFVAPAMIILKIRSR